MSGRTDRRPWVASGKRGLTERFGENLRLLRARAHVSQETLAFRADIHRTQISLLESGSRVPRLDTTVKLAGALEVELATLLDGIVYRPNPFSAARGEFEISAGTLFDGGSSGDGRGSGR